MKKFRTPKQNRIYSDKSVATQIFKYIGLIVLLAYALSIILSFSFAFITSLKTDYAFKHRLMSLPFGEDLRLENYSEVFQMFRAQIVTSAGTKFVYFFDLLYNSLIFSVGGAFLATLFCCMTAYAVARFKNWMSGFIYGTVIVCMALPIVGSMSSEVQMLNNLHLYDTQIGLLCLTSSFLGMHFLVFHAAFKAIPKDFAEAAKIDGAGEWRIFLTIMLPLVRLAFLTIFLLKFMIFWNNYETPLIHTPNHPVLAYGVWNVYHKTQAAASAGLDIYWPHKIAAGMVVLLPMLILFLFTHKRLIGNVSMGGVKG